MEEIPTEQLDVIFYHGAYPLWQYLKQALGIDIVDVCARVAKEEPVLKTLDGRRLAARVVSRNEMLDKTDKLDPTLNNDVIFLLNSINVVFKTLQLGVERGDEKVLKDYKFDLDAETNHMWLTNVLTGNPADDRRIAVQIIE